MDGKIQPERVKLRLWYSTRRVKLREGVQYSTRRVKLREGVQYSTRRVSYGLGLELALKRSTADLIRETFLVSRK